MLAGLQKLRALAAYSVVFYHCIIRFVAPTDSVSRSYVDLPGAGVDLFFVISGFIMAHTTPDDEGPGSFMAKRISRIVPLYWIATMLVVVLVALRAWTFPNADISPGSVLASLLFVPHVDLSGELYPVLGVGWTLNYEMMFYLLFAGSLLSKPSWRLAFLVGLVTLVWVSGVLIGGEGIARFYANSVVFEFAAGSVIAHLLRRDSVRAFVVQTPMWPLMLAALAAFLVLPAFVPIETPQLFRYGIPAALLVFAVAAQDMYRKPGSQGLLARLGDASYSAYLLHPMIILAVAFGIDATGIDGFLAAVLLTTAALGGTALVSLASMKSFEKPSARYLRRLMLGRPQKHGAPLLRR